MYSAPVRELDLGNGVIVPGHLLRATASRSSGPGGQNVNKVETRVTIEAEVDALPLSEHQKKLVRSRLATRINRAGYLHVTSQAERSQIANRDRALSRMEELLQEALHEDKPRRPTRVSKGHKQKRLDSKKRHAEKKRLRSRLDD